MTSPEMSAFAQYIPGFEFLQNLTRQAAGGAGPGTASGVPGMPPMSHWVAPTFDVEELDKRIQDLRAVHFWLDQNTKALAATIQALEVQKMTLATLKSMNVSLQDMAEAFQIRPAPEAPPPARPESPEPAAAPATGPAAAPAEASAPAVDPMQWWTALTNQFQTIATGAIRDMAEHAAKASVPPVPAAKKTKPRASTPKPRAAAAPAKSASRKKAPAAAPARRR